MGTGCRKLSRLPKWRSWGKTPEKWVPPGEETRCPFFQRRNQKGLIERFRLYPEGRKEKLPRETVASGDGDFPSASRDSRREGVPRAQHVFLQGLRRLSRARKADRDHRLEQRSGRLCARHAALLGLRDRRHQR